MATNVKLIIISGLPGSGKSTLAEAVANKFKFPIFSVDPIESAILKSGIKKNFETGLAAYIVAEVLASEQLKIGISVIIDAVNPVSQARITWRNLSKKYQAKLIIIECILDSGLHRKRLESRVRNLHGIAEVKWEDINNLLKEYTPWEDEKLSLDTAGSPESNLDKVLKYINEI